MSRPALAAVHASTVSLRHPKHGSAPRQPVSWDPANKAIRLCISSRLQFGMRVPAPRMHAHARAADCLAWATLTSALASCISSMRGQADTELLFLARLFKCRSAGAEMSRAEGLWI